MACLFINCNPVYFYSTQKNGANVSFNIYMVNKSIYNLQTRLHNHDCTSTSVMESQSYNWQS